MISMSFQLVGFLLTYLLHTTHAAKNGSRAGLGVTLIQYGFYMRGTGAATPGDGGAVVPDDPDSHDFDPDRVAQVAGAAATQDVPGAEWMSYALMVVGWFILIRSVGQFLAARRHEQLVLQSPDRGLGTAVVAEGESSERVV